MLKINQLNSNASITIEEMVDFDLSERETMLPEGFSLDDLFPELPEPTYSILQKFEQRFF